MRTPAISMLLVISLVMISGQAYAEKWVEFHHESWTHDSKKLKKKLHFSNTSYYDADSLRRTGSDDVIVMIRDVSHNDRFYVGKGIPEKEEVFKRIRLRCGAAKYEVILEDGENSEAEETVGEDITVGSVYDKLFKKVCGAVR